MTRYRGGGVFVQGRSVGCWSVLCVVDRLWLIARLDNATITRRTIAELVAGKQAWPSNEHRSLIASDARRVLAIHLLSSLHTQQSRYAVIPASCCCCCCWSCCCCYCTLWLQDAGLDCIMSLNRCLGSSIIHDSTDYQTNKACTWSTQARSSRLQVKAIPGETFTRCESKSVPLFVWQFFDPTCKSRVDKDTKIHQLLFYFMWNVLSLSSSPIVYINVVSIKVKK